ncbi:hypothetical protein H310_10742 [Aphanomyces invadans]|uniref:Uncharacterized protein n=1 Tax=Aphanomyces invadans TaxID=157072 RepID=A0A024TPM5_9STRA|nr:hypothetical protein H310_10742 [Aphanomyces invadans]ETV96105.1 hypothetical protein H310_10742 [Aphanomyces invadans]|eukprot:XP_008875416.1 hypothetical protein H310_10742 [Aphanomyces invadans]
MSRDLLNGERAMHGGSFCVSYHGRVLGNARPIRVFRAQDPVNHERVMPKARRIASQLTRQMCGRHQVSIPPSSGSTVEAVKGQVILRIAMNLSIVFALAVGATLASAAAPLANPAAPPSDAPQPLALTRDREWWMRPIYRPIVVLPPPIVYRPVYRPVVVVRRPILRGWEGTSDQVASSSKEKYVPA